VVQVAFAVGVPERCCLGPTKYADPAFGWMLECAQVAAQ
jgi:hypothetical protein